MASKTVRNTVATIAMAEAVAHSLMQAYEGRPRNSTVMDMGKRLESAASAARGLWSNELGCLDKVIIIDRIGAMKETPLAGAKAMPVYTSFCMATMERIDTSNMISEKAAALSRVFAALKRINRYFDRELKRFELYDTANAIVEAWESMDK